MAIALRPAPGLPPVASAPSWFLTVHAVNRIQEMGLSRPQVLDVLDGPTLSYPSPPQHGPDRRIYVGGGLVVVVNDADRIVITVLWAGREGRTPSDEAGRPGSDRVTSP